MEARILIGDARKRLAELPAGSVRTCITSPPYFGLRDYGTASWDGGDPECPHTGKPMATKANINRNTGGNDVKNATALEFFRERCERCGAMRIDSQMGLEETPDAYVEEMVLLFREVWRVLADDGTLWLNLGDSYAMSSMRGKESPFNGKVNQSKTGIVNVKKSIPQGLKPKDLIGIPWRVAFALQADGWYLRQDIIWAKPNPMPESVTDRCTKSHEYVFLLSKSARYYYDHEAVKERGVMVAGDSAGSKQRDTRETHGLGGGNSGISVAKAKLAQELADKGYSTRNRRDVWTIASKPFKGAHFAVMPEALVEPCVLAGSSEKGKCSECGKPWMRMVKSTRLRRNELDPSDSRYRPNTYKGAYENINGKGDAGYTITETLGWEATCECDAEIVPDTVLDPFTGSGTVAVVALRHGRNFVGTELNPEYGEIAKDRITNAAPMFNQVEIV